MSTCAKCGQHVFRVQKQEPLGSQFIVYFIECSSCGTPVGILEYANSSARLEILERKIDALENKIDHISSSIADIVFRIRNLNK